ncbi:hypothetical protein ARMGADRAFT_1090127 [Armillaria gallica]|uniref:Uncharacterized protein n=1 Tax=Armillaria gallica TaxID=47427 RepID=A0A2H3D0Y0_ARMGA|nr:hypothetical protein ARMGADRAFT_1090127 [Armillaria gallica]
MLIFFKNLISLMSLSLYSPNIVALKCMNRSPDTLKSSMPGANYYVHILSFWKEQAHMPVWEGQGVYSKDRGICNFMLDSQPDMHPPDQDVEMVGDDSDELGNEETDESEDSGGDMDKD